MILQFGVEFKEYYELLVSAWAASFIKQQGQLDLSPDWFKWCTAKLSTKNYALLDEVRRMDPSIPIALLLAYPEDTAAGFIEWVNSLSGNEAFEIVYSFDPNGQRKPPQNLRKACQTLAAGLKMWNDLYFGRLAKPILQDIQVRAQADQERTLEFENQPQELIKNLTQSLIWEAQSVTTITLIPQAHLSPWPVYQIGGDHGVIFYPVQSRLLNKNPESTILERLLKALGDPSRLQILQLIGENVVRFTDLVEQSGLAKSTVHHHIITLRSAGLLWLHVSDDTSTRFSIRWETIKNVSPLLEGILLGK